MGLYRNLGLCFSHLPRLLVEEDATSAAAAAAAALADSVTTTGPSPFPSPPSARSSSVVPFRPSIAVIVGVLTTMFSLTFLLLLYAKHRKQTSAGLGGGGGVVPGFPAAAVRRNSGVERTVVESLPVFRFGSLSGHKEGLECAVCLNRFEPVEALRLLPKCRHAFHVECVDTWLDAHSTCPLCRVRVDPEDVLLVPRPDPNPPSSGCGGKPPRDSKTTGDDTTANPTPYGRRISGRHSSAGEKCSNSLQIVVHRADPANRMSADCAVARGGAAGGSFEPERGKVRKDGLLLPVDRQEFDRRYSHRIVVSDGDGMQERWSDLRPSDLLFLRSEMIITDSGRFSASRAGRASGSSTGGGRDVISARCASEITGRRRPPIRAHSGGGGGARREVEEERTMRRWLGFAAKRRARWLGSRDGANELST
uniref:RING-type E3 ubiquitin transferase n=1 Tax=Elaeis guineensis var. tenera TaxID=51953 RepID=A0A6I9RR99_ELAGV|nr:RING-H2 finger protein ATL43-like [Elaeis guineensis]